ncbi:hypothetical protein BUALT_Bualt10G0079300 [Buddleja alternifolia]|uniref:BED-type domain-containing protein n=1 Tax=Buddleja alternifolia TaxID=168488 RepID=A0AAV6WW48_9LAMI|nr:hypothetical protein BUALT_Bualt10G0079300 [Buddleja alternifolia]
MHVEDMCRRYPNATSVNVYGTPDIHSLVMEAVFSLRNLEVLTLGKGQLGDDFSYYNLVHYLSSYYIHLMAYPDDNIRGNKIELQPAYMESQEVESVQSINHRDDNTEVEMIEIDGDNHEEECATLETDDIRPQESGKRKQTSKVWEHFKKVKVDDIQYAECKYCKIHVKAPPGFGTTGLFKHYQKACKKRPRGLDIRQSLIKTSKKVNGAEELTTHIFSQEYTRSELARMVILHDYPLSIVEHVGFRRYSASLQPSFTMISRNTLKNDIFSIYNDEKVKFYKLLEKLKCRVAITTDMWTASNNKKGFMAITAHFIDDSWRLQSCILRFIYVPAPHTADVLCDLLANALMDCNIDRKVSTITVDNCTTNDAMLRRLLDRLPTKDMLLDGKVLHMRCCAHILNLIVKDGLETISSTIERIRDSVVYWTASPTRVEKFEKVARQLNVSCGKKLSLDCKTRWNSTYLMLQTAITYKDVFPRAKARDIHYRSLPIDEDWENAVEICSKLKLFYNVTEMFSGTLYPTSNFYFKKNCEIKVKLDEWVKSTNVMIQDMAKDMLEKYEKYWDSCHILMGVAAVLDPRYKMKLVEFYFPLIYPKSAQSKIAEIRQSCYDLLVDYQTRVATNLKDTSSVGGSGKSGSMSSGVASVSESEHLDMFDQFVASSSNFSTKASLTSELDFYLEESVLPRTSEFDVLSWWKTNGVKYPNLQKSAKDILAIPVSTVASESAFSTSGRLVSPHRNRLHPSTLEALMCGRRWLWNEGNGTCSKFSGLEVCPTMLDEEEDEESFVET